MKTLTPVEFPPPFEPKVENRFIVKIGKPFNIPPYVISSAKRPSFTKANNGIKWDDMVFTMYDPITPSTSQTIMEGLKKLENQESQSIEITIQVMGPVGDAVEEWKIIGEIDSIDFGRLDWKSDETLMIELYLKTQYVTLNY